MAHTMAPAADLSTADSSYDGSALPWSFGADEEGEQAGQAGQAAEAPPFDMCLPTMRLAPLASRHDATSPTQATSPLKTAPVKTAPALFSPMVTTPRDFAFSPESEPELTPPPLYARTTPPPLYARSAARGVPTTSTADGGVSPRVAWGQWGAQETKTAPAPMLSAPAHAVVATPPSRSSQQRLPQRVPVASATASVTGRHTSAHAPSSLMGAPVRVCKPSASPFAAPLARAPTSYAPEYAATHVVPLPPTGAHEDGREGGHSSGLEIAEEILAAAAASEVHVAPATARSHPAPVHHGSPTHHPHAAHTPPTCHPHATHTLWLHRRRRLSSVRSTRYRKGPRPTRWPPPPTGRPGAIAVASSAAALASCRPPPPMPLPCLISLPSLNPNPTESPGSQMLTTVMSVAGVL